MEEEEKFKVYMKWKSKSSCKDQNVILFPYHFFSFYFLEIK